MNAWQTIIALVGVLLIVAIMVCACDLFIALIKDKELNEKEHGNDEANHT